MWVIGGQVPGCDLWSTSIERYRCTSISTLLTTREQKGFALLLECISFISQYTDIDLKGNCSYENLSALHLPVCV